MDDGFKVNFHGFGVGVQIYTWNGTDWGKAVPRATLFDDEGNVVASHFARPEVDEQQWQHRAGNRCVMPPP